jgi:hypothetical protein
MNRERAIIAILAVALAVAVGSHFYPSETAGQRLRRECASIVREANASLGATEETYWFEDEVSYCITARGRAGQ